MDTKINDFYLQTGLIASKTPKVVLGLGALAVIAGAIFLSGHIFHTSQLKLVSFDMAAAIAAAGILGLIVSQLAKQRRFIHIITVVSFIMAGLAAASWQFKYGVNSDISFSVMIGSGALAAASALMWKNTGVLSKKEMMEKMKKGIEIELACDFHALHKWLHDETKKINKLNKERVREWKDFLKALNGKKLICNGVGQFLNTEILLESLKGNLIEMKLSVRSFKDSQKRDFTEGPSKGARIRDKKTTAQINQIAQAYSETFGLCHKNAKKKVEELLENYDLKVVKLSKAIVGGAFYNDKGIAQTFKLALIVELDVQAKVSKKLAKESKANILDVPSNDNALFVTR